MNQQSYPKESGPVSIQGKFFYNNGKIWRWQGASMFLLLERLMNGEHISPQIDWMQKHRVNVARVFIAGVDWTGHDFLYKRSDWLSSLQSMDALLAISGIRLEATVCTSQGNDMRWVPILQDIYDALQGRWNVFVEWVNEPGVQGDGLTWAWENEYSIPSAYGINPEADNESWLPCRHLGYITPHLARDMDHYPRNGKELLEMREAYGVPIVDDEPLGIADYDKSGSGARTTNRIAVASHFGIAAMYGNGATNHSQFGLEGRIPSENEPISEELSTTITDIWNYIPPEYHRDGGYYAPHLPHFPIDTSRPYSTLNHAYASIIDNIGYVVVPMPVSGFIPKGVEGWRVADQLHDLPIWRVEK